MKKDSFAKMIKRFAVILAAVIFFTAVLPQKCEAASAASGKTQMKDGEYSVEVIMEGGSGRASVTSPAPLIIKDGQAWARIEWSSPNYDYMKIGEDQYLPVNEEGNSVFEIPVSAFDEPVAVIADTTAMSVPHEIEYTLTFISASITSGNGLSENVIWIAAGGILIVIAVILVIWLMNRKRRKIKR